MGNDKRISKDKGYKACWLLAKMRLELKDSFFPLVLWVGVGEC